MKLFTEVNKKTIIDMVNVNIYLGAELRKIVENDLKLWH